MSSSGLSAHIEWLRRDDAGWQRGKRLYASRERCHAEPAGHRFAAETIGSQQARAWQKLRRFPSRAGSRGQSGHAQQPHSTEAESRREWTGRSTQLMLQARPRHHLTTHRLTTREVRQCCRGRFGCEQGGGLRLPSSSKAAANGPASPRSRSGTSCQCRWVAGRSKGRNSQLLEARERALSWSLQSTMRPACPTQFLDHHTEFFLYRLGLFPIYILSTRFCDESQARWPSFRATRSNVRSPHSLPNFGV